MSVNGNDLTKVPAKVQSKFKPVESFEWDEYLKAQNGVPAPVECFNQSAEPPVNEFGMHQKLEINSPTNDFDFVHLATVVGFVGPRLQLRLDGCDSSNDIFELVDSAAIHPIGARVERKKYFAAPLRFRKDAASYNSYCKSIMKTAEFAPKHAFKKPPQEPRENLFKPGMKLEAVDQKHPSNICPATIAAVDKDQVTIHLDGWDESNDYKCSYKARSLFPVGWCKKTGCFLTKPGPKAETPHPTNDGESNNSNLKTDDKEVKEVSTTVKKTTTSMSGDVNKKEKESSVVSEPQSSNVNKPNVVVVTKNQTLQPKNNVLNNKTEAKLTTPKPLTGVEVKANSSAPTGAKLVNNEPPKTPNCSPVNHLASTNISHKSISVNMNKLPAPASALSPSLPPSLPVPPTTSVGATMKNTSTTTVPIAPKGPFPKPTPQGATVVPTTTVYVTSKSVNNHNVHISPKRNNIGEQIKQQQQHHHHQQQQQQQQQQQFQRPMVSSYQILVTQPSTLQVNNTLNTLTNSRGVKRTQPPMTEMRKSQAVQMQTTMKPVMKQNNTAFHTFNNKPASTPTNVVQNQVPIIMPQTGHIFLAPLPPKQVPAPTLTINNSSAATLATNQVPVVNGCKKPSTISTPDSDLPDPNIVKGWTVDEVITFLSSMLPDFSKYESLFRSHEIDGNAFLLLTNESLIKFMSIKLGYSLKICNIVDRINSSDS